MNTKTTKSEATKDGVKKPAARRRTTLQQKLDEMLAEHYGTPLPSWKRVAAANIAAITLSCGAGYGIGTIAGYAIVGVMMLEGGMLLSFLIMIASLLLTIYVSLKIGQHVGNYILSGQIDRDIVAAKNKVVGLFKRPRLSAA